MAWTYTQPSHNSGWSDKNTRIIWENRWSVSEQTPDAAHPGKIRLRVAVVTERYYVSPTGYVSPVSDTISYNGTSIAVHSGTLTTGDHDYTYEEDVYIPLSWSGKTIELYICWTRVSVVCGAVGDFSSTIAASNGYFGYAIPITLTRKVSGTTHTVTVSCGGRTDTLLTNSTATSVNWTPALATYGPLFTSAMSGTATINCTTYFGTSSMTSNKSITVSFKAADVKPTVSTGWATHTYYNTGTAASNITAYVQGYSQSKVTFDQTKISTKYGATVASYKIVCGGVTDGSSPYLTGTLTGTSATITCYVYDSRGQYASGTLSVTLNAYSKPKLSNIKIIRSDSSGTESADGSYITVKATSTISSIGGANTATMKVFTKVADASSYTDKGAITSNTNKTISSYNPDTSYDVKITLTDSLGNSATYVERLPTRKWAMKFRPNGNGVAFGKAAETDKRLELPSDWGLRVGTKELFYLPGAYTLTGPCFGFITTSGQDALLYFVPRMSLAAATAATVTKVTGVYVRTSDGGYLGGANATLTEYISDSTMLGGTVRVVLHNGGGWGITNNTPVCGLATITFTIT